MHPATAVFLSASLLAAAGCLSGGAPARSENAPESNFTASAPSEVATTAERSAPANAIRNVVNWTGFMKVGAAYEAPSHVGETNAATRAVWSPSFHYDARSTPHDLEVRLDWTAAAGELQFMVILPDNATGTETLVESQFADHGPLCVKLPPTHLAPGRYSIMAHSKFAVDARLAFSVSTIGGDGRLVDEPHAAPAADFSTFLSDTLAGDGGGGNLDPRPCAAG